MHTNTIDSKPAAHEPPSWDLCGAGSYHLSAGGTTLGGETFEITCNSDGSYSAKGQTKLNAGALSLDLATVLELAPDLVPKSASAKGTVQGQAFDQSGTFANGTATLVNNGTTQTVPYTPGASWLGGNIFYTNVFIVARYDDAKGGAQTIPIFPNQQATIERKGDATVTNAGAPAKFTRYSMRVAGQEIALFRDASRRLAIIAVPAQGFIAARPEVAKIAPDVVRAPAEGSAPSSSGTTSTAIDYSAPPGASFTAEEVTIPVASYVLAGTLLEPKGATRPLPAVVMITGSGLQTRDQRIPLPGLEHYAPFRQIAERLASHGVAVLRVDDRGIGGSTGRETLEKATTTSLAEDTRAQIAWLRKRSEIDPKGIVVIGHSEGASIAAMIGATDKDLAGVVMMAGVAKPGSEVSVEQQEDLLRSNPDLTEAQKTELRAKQKEAVKTILAGGEIPGQPINAWTREYFSYDPLPAVRKLTQPLLILQGERDRQVDQSHAALVADAARKAGNTHVTVQVFPTLNHLFLPSKTGSFNEYSHLETTTVPDAVLDAITQWVTALRTRG